MKLESDVFCPVPPLFQPLRFWTQRTLPERSSFCKEDVSDSGAKKPGVRQFSMRGGFITIADGERRMVIAGKLFRG